MVHTTGQLVYMILGHHLVLFGFGRAMTNARCHFFGMLHLRRHEEKKEHSHLDVLLPCFTNSGCILSLPGAFPALSFNGIF